METETGYRMEKNTLVITVGSELDHHNAVDIKQKTESYVCKYQIKNIVFDFSKTNFMDSSGIGLIMGRYKVMEQLNGQICVTNVNAKLERFFVISGLYKLVDRYPTVWDAIR
jgi:stage II sporulation protein AA (anti-sigma F factor antagonist)